MESLPGVDKQVRSHRRTPHVRRRRGAGVELPEVAGAASCGGCGDAVPRAEVLYGADGAVCGPCFGREEDQLADRDRTWLREAAWTVAGAAGLVALTVWLMGHMVGDGHPQVVVSSWVEPPMGLENLPWFLFFSPLFLVGATLALQALRQARTRWVLRGDPQIGAGPLAAHAISAGLSVLAASVLLGIALLPLVR